MPASTIPPIGPSSEDVLKSEKLSFFGLSVNSKGNLIINEPKLFIKRFGLNGLTEEDLAESETIGFKDLSTLKTFIDKNVSAGSTTYNSDTYDALFDENSTLHKEVATAQKDQADRQTQRQTQRDILGLPEKTEDQEPEFKDKDGRLINSRPPAPAPAPGQAQAARPTLDQPGGATSAAAFAAAQSMPDYVKRLSGHGRWRNRQKAQMLQEAKRRQQNKIADLKKSEKARKRAGEVDEILNAKNDQYRQLYANSSEDRSVEDWDAMSRDQKIKLIQNYNINRSLGAPAGEVSGQKMNALESPRGSLEDLVYWDESKQGPFRNETGGPQAEAPAPSLSDMRMDQMRDFARTPAISPETKTTATQGFDQISAPNGVPMTELETLNVSPMDDAAKQAALPQAFQNRGIREGEAPYDPARGLTNLQNPAPAPKQSSILNTPAPSIAQPDNGMSTALPMDSVDLMNQVDAYEKANPPIPPSTAVTPVVSPESYNPQVRTPGSPDIDMEGIQSQVSTDTRKELQSDQRLRDLLSKLPPPDELLDARQRDSRYKLPVYSQQVPPKPTPAPKKEEGFFDKLMSFDPYGFVEDYQSVNNKPISPDELARMRKAPQKSLQSLLDDPVYQQNVAKRNAAPQKSLQSLLDDPVYQQNVAKRNNLPAPQAPAPAAKLPSADPFLDDEPAEMQGPKEKMVPIYGRDGIVGYRSYSDQRKAAQDYSKRRMQESPRSLLGQTYSGDMDRLYPTLNTGDIKREIDQENIARFSKNNPFGEEYRPKGKRYNPFA